MESDPSRLDELARRRGRGNAAAPPGGFASELELWLAEDLDAAANGRWLRIFEEEPEPPPVLVDGLIPCDVFGLVGPGGVAKSTFTLWLMMRVILGLPIGARQVRDPGPCVYVSAEDPAPTAEYRVRRLADAMGLSELQRGRVAKQLHLEDWTGRLRRLVEADGSGNLAMTGWADGVVAKYRAAGIRLVAFDPAVFFGPGERFINDAEASLMQAGRLVSAGLGGAAVGFVHHVGQLAARDGLVDQYAARGGSAFADNSRAQLVINAPGGESAAYPRPFGVLGEDIASGRAFRVHVAKFSAGPRDRQPLWVVRGAADPWDFQVHEPPTDAAAAIEERQAAAAEAAATAAILAVWQHVRDNQDRTPQTRTSIKDAPPGGLSQRAAISAVQQCLNRGYLREERLPVDLRQGSRVMSLRTTETQPGATE